MRRSRKKRMPGGFLWIALWMLMLCLPVTAEAAGTAASVEEKAENLTEKESRGWHNTRNGRYYYILSNGKRAVGWRTIKKKVYYFDSQGYRTTSWKKISGKFYYFNKSGVRQTEWVSYGKYRYYCDPEDNGARVTGWRKIGKYTYYFNGKGRMVTGWLKQNGNYYYLNKSGRRLTGWQTISGKRYYFSKTTGIRAKGWKKISGYYYYFNKNGILLKDSYTPDGYYVDAEGKRLKKSTLKEFLQIALQPVGSTMYVWGGGWGTDGANIDARTIGVSAQWRRFFNSQTSSYDYRTTRYQSRNGLDCSGFVGWAIYNAFNTKSGNSGYVYLAQQMTRIFSSKGWGTYTAAGAVKNYRAGDIMSTSDGHVYIVLGSCSDGSVVLIHSSPSGVQINGTYTPSGKQNSYAVQLATKYMKKYYPKWYKKFPNCSRGTSYLIRYSRMRWKLKGNCMMSDPDRYADKNAKQILADLFGE
ncbi:MAG: hypothetical protein Q4E91_01160 [Lachnospiraceae bacterium]|nr:hypothetical protein [Lachnospiraceae bacterium]